MLARLHTGRWNCIALQNSYHGASPYARQLTSHVGNIFGIKSYKLIFRAVGNITYMAVVVFTIFQILAYIRVFLAMTKRRI